jgi:hypothetical protein
VKRLVVMFLAALSIVAACGDAETPAEQPSPYTVPSITP